MTGLWQYIEQAGTIGYILVIVSVISITVILERTIFWAMNGWFYSLKQHSELLTAFKNKDQSSILNHTKKMKKVEQRAISYIGNNLHSLDDKPLDIALSREVSATNRWLAILQVNSSIAPMLGILGTVTGIIQSFKGMSGGAPDTGLMVSGISVSMLTTAIGLIVALISLVPLNWLAAKAHKRQTALAELLQECWVAKGK